ncbi:Rne/Rng family ribonuclease [Actinomyces weissii]|uniref:Rne/Rng family ribonuclease n=1 Tax=Actinomyces weissii TaxID=675090 RepID=UPI0038991378
MEAAAAEPPAVEIPAAEAAAVEAAEAEADEAEQPAAAEAAAEAPAETAPELSEPSPAPAPKRRRRKVVAAQAAPAPAPEPEVAPAEAALAPEEEAELLEAELLEAEPETSEDSPRLPAASLLFQAPDPARAKRRRRKATAAAQAPQAAPQAEPPASDQAGSDEGEAVTEAAPAPAKRRRRKATAAAQAPQAAPEAEPQPTDADTSETPEAEAAAEGEEQERGTRKRRRGGRGRRSRNRAEEGEASSSAEDAPQEALSEGETSDDDDVEAAEGSSRRRRRRRSRSRAERAESRDVRDEITAPKGSTRLEAKRQRRREGRAAGRRRPIVTEAEFLARRESVERQMIVREQGGLNQIAVLEDGLLVEHYVARRTQTSMVGNVYIGRVQNVLPSMEAAFVDLGKGRNAVLYAGEVNWDAAGMEGRPRRIEEALSNGDTVLVQVTKDPIGHKGARLTSQVTLAGRYLVLVPGGTMTGISRKLPDTERSRLKKILKKVVPDDAGVIVRTAAEGASEEQLSADVQRLLKQWESIDKKAKQVMSGSGKAPVLLKGEPELAVRVVRDVFNEDFKQLIVSGRDAWATISEYVTELSPDLADRLVHWVEPQDVFAAHRVDEQLAKGFDRKVWLPSGGTLVIDRTEAMTVIDVNTGRFTGGAGGTLEETVTRNNLEAAEEIVRQLRLRDIGGMVVIDFVDMVLEANRDLVLRRLVECLGRDRTRHQVTEVTSLGLVQMTRKRVGQGLVEAFSTQCDCCGGRGFIVHDDPVENQAVDMSASASRGSGRGRRSKQEPSASGARERGTEAGKAAEAAEPVDEASREVARNALAQIAAAAEQAHRS